MRPLAACCGGLPLRSKPLVVMRTESAHRSANAVARKHPRGKSVIFWIAIIYCNIFATLTFISSCSNKKQEKVTSKPIVNVQSYVSEGIGISAKIDKKRSIPNDWKTFEYETFSPGAGRVLFAGMRSAGTNRPPRGGRPALLRQNELYHGYLLQNIRRP